mgnify:FL=1|jgi:hypothetical protein|tara:strand:+ start:62 stop:745 length:684 start_codon:yes stop_codon:yes gene_type:complete
MKAKNDLKDYIKASHSKAINKQKHMYLYDNVYVKDPLPEDFDLNYVLQKIETSIPDYLMSNIDTIYIGQFDEFVDREINAIYKDGALYTTNLQDDEDDMIDDIVHEMAHSIEEFAGNDIYGDGRVENEFLGKRQKLFYLLKEEGYNVHLKDFLESNYSKEFDMFLYQEVGYELMTTITMGLFVSSYSATSLKEYFATGFEKYYLEDRKYLKNISPILFEKIEYISSF